ncbi:MAG: response regulator [Gemmatimonadaceae bacterium]|nr:response regulator [Gemmatimonadaceae bacterium]
MLLSRTPDSPLETRYVDLIYLRIADADGQSSVIAHGNDVTESVLATQELSRAKQLLFDQFAKLPVPTYLWESREDDFVLLISNEAAVRAAPSHGSRAIGRLSRDLFPGMDAVREEMATALRDNVVVRCTAQFDGGPKLGMRRVELTIGPQQPSRVLVHAVDTTARIELEAQLRQAQKMDAVGRLAGGVAHDFNNLLTVIGAHAAFLLESLDSGDALHEDAEAIQKAGIRAAGLTRQLLAFSRKQILKPSVLDLNAVVGEMENMLRRLLGEDIEIVTRLAPIVKSVIADASQIEQVIMNLAVNGRDAMPDGGTLTISTQTMTIDESSVHSQHIVPRGEYALIEVSDTGVGMDATVKARLFEPFFTTKELGKGTGLGLATVYGVVKQSAGYILVDSTPGKGTTFRVYLPAVEPSAARDDLRVAEDSAVRGIETILLVEDEPAVREIARRILIQKGYVVLPASNGAEALATSAAFDSTIHLVISDSVMPGMTGAEVVRRLQEQRPGLKALFMSGYTDDEILRRGIVSSTAAFIQKPFMRDDFSRAVREVLDG